MHCGGVTEEGPPRREPPHSWDRAGATQEPGRFKEVAHYQTVPTPISHEPKTPLGTQPCSLALLLSDLSEPPSLSEFPCAHL